MRNEIIAAHIFTVFVLRNVESNFHIVILFDLADVHEILNVPNEFGSLLADVVIVQIGISEDALETQVRISDTSCLLDTITDIFRVIEI